MTIATALGKVPHPACIVKKMDIDVPLRELGAIETPLLQIKNSRRVS